MFTQSFEKDTVYIDFLNEPYYGWSAIQNLNFDRFVNLQKAFLRYYSSPSESESTEIYIPEVSTTKLASIRSPLFG